MLGSVERNRCWFSWERGASAGVPASTDVRKRSYRSPERAARTDTTQVVSGERYRQVSVEAVGAELEVSKILPAAFSGQRVIAGSTPAR
ncbi:hypothetical protein MPL1032_40085 [Mesorhizobium plurifarium]|uniref:Uncharacterized protein n=1 Tax=Mesorhizobium plurifarium TaxID=69974 RepID=A0A0K2W5I0_MESPL|nr:hypothetical protein MPL1032_40085 [Mesorhizobium plurifarium]